MEGRLPDDRLAPPVLLAGGPYDVIPVRRDGLVDGPHPLHERRVLIRIEGIIVVGGVQCHLFHPADLRHPVGHAQNVKVQHGAHQRAARRREQQTPPAAPEHPQGLGQQHGGGVVADGPRHQHAHQQGQHLVVPALLEAPPEQLVEEQSSQQGGKARDAAA